MYERSDNTQRLCTGVQDGCKPGEVLFLFSSLSASAQGSVSTMYLLTALIKDHAASRARENW
jgi:hypothetical protein